MVLNQPRWSDHKCQLYRRKVISGISPSTLLDRAISGTAQKNQQTISSDSSAWCVVGFDLMPSVGRPSHICPAIHFG